MTPNQLPPPQDVLALARKMKATAEDCSPHPRYSDSMIAFRTECIPANVIAVVDALTALAQQTQDPVAWLYVDTVGERYLCFSRPTGGGAITNLYATPPAPQAPGRRKGPPGITLEPQSHEQTGDNFSATPKMVQTPHDIDALIDRVSGAICLSHSAWDMADARVLVLEILKQAGPLYTTPPAPQPAPVDERADFEAWARPNGYDMRRNDVLGHYSSIDTLRAWTGWQARAALQSPAPQAGGWLPIESAPKDGTRLILWWGGKPVFAGWLDNSQCKHPWAGWQTPSLTPRPQGEPTHYMPPPPAPQTEGMAE